MYPNWATKYKVKGTILRKKDKSSYYLFKVHSERQKGKKYPVLIQDELIGTINENGISYNVNKLVDVSNLKIIPFYECFLYEDFSVSEKELFSNVFLLKIKNKWYFSNITNSQILVLESKNINWVGGIDENN